MMPTSTNVILRTITPVSFWAVNAVAGEDHLVAVDQLHSVSPFKTVPVRCVKVLTGNAVGVGQLVQPC